MLVLASTCSVLLWHVQDMYRYLQRWKTGHLQESFTTASCFETSPLAALADPMARLPCRKCRVEQTGESSKLLRRQRVLGHSGAVVINVRLQQAWAHKVLATGGDFCHLPDSPYSCRVEVLPPRDFLKHLADPCSAPSVSIRFHPFACFNMLSLRSRYRGDNQ